MKGGGVFLSARLILLRAAGAGLLLALAAAGCGRAEVREEGPRAEALPPAPERISFPPPPGPRKAVAVLPLGLSRRAAERYPELRAQWVGFGVHNMIVDALAETRWFRFIEINPEVMEQLVKQLWMATSDLVDPAHALRLGKLRQPSAVIYGEVFEFGVTRRERLVGLQSREEFVTRIGIQLRLVDPQTAEYVPASGEGQHLSGERVRYVGRDVASFAESGVGAASRLAIRRAVLELLRRVP